MKKAVNGNLIFLDSLQILISELQKHSSITHSIQAYSYLLKIGKLTRTRFSDLHMVLTVQAPSKTLEGILVSLQNTYRMLIKRLEELISVAQTRKFPLKTLILKKCESILDDLYDLYFLAESYLSTEPATVPLEALL